MSATTTKAWCADPRCGHAKALHTARGCPLCQCDGHMPSLHPDFDHYAMAHGTSPAAMLDRDAVRWPGGKLTGFMAWWAMRKAQFDARHPDGSRSDFTLFLEGALP